MNSGLHRVLWTLVGHPPVAEWEGAEERLREQRAQIEASLAQAPHPVYGFTTLLGHEDDRPLDDQQESLFQAHLVRPTSIMPGRLAQVLLACKIEQLSHGRSGVRPQIYRQLLTATMAEDRPCRGNWRYSYGAGDVVQGAWLVYAVSTELLPRSTDLVAEPGDLITLINGTHVSTGMAAATVLTALGELAQFVQAYRAMVAATPAAGQQAPVSLRDSEPVLTEVTAALLNVGRELEQRLAGPSGNPLFVPQEGGWQAVSQASFLGLGLTSALTRLQQALCLTLGVWQRMIAHACAAGGGDAVHLLQPPKVAQAVVESHLLAAGVPSRFTGQDSHGVEDVRDLSLILTHSVAALLPGMSALRSIWADLPADHRPASFPDVGLIEEELLGLLLDGDVEPDLLAARPVLTAQHVVTAWLAEVSSPLGP